MPVLKVMSVMAHQDDFEFNAGGHFARLRHYYGNAVSLKVLTTNRGASGHHQMDLEATYRRREAEARKSAALIGAEYDCLTCLDGSHLPGSVFIDQNMLGGLWNAIRDFEPDFIFCPPVISDPLAGIHIDHFNTAWAVRMVAYQLTVPHAYPTMGGVPKDRVPYPVIINVDDVYACENGYDSAVDIADVYEEKVAMALCHESQIYEWLPWNGGSEEFITESEYRMRFRKRHTLVNQRYGLDDSRPREYFKFTQWGKRVDEAARSKIFPSS